MQKTDIVAIDGGGTKTLLLRVRPDGSIAEMRKAGGSNPFDVPEWRSVVRSLLQDQSSHMCAAALGMAGYGESRRLSQELAALVAGLCPVPHVIHNDVDMACRGAFLNQPGVLLLSGTGSMAWGQGKDGQTARVGGWGSLFGDEGSAYAIGRAALFHLARALDGRETDESDYVTRFAALRGWPEDHEECGAALLEWYATLDEARPAVAALAIDTGKLAEMGCPVSLGIMERAAHDLALHVQALRNRLAFPDLPWSYAGGTMRSAVLRDAIAHRCGLPVDPCLPPIGGAVITAAALAGWSVDSGFVDRLGTSFRAASLI
ncbi:BadF/BadG/BcrA/BcrD ATPase family protein [Asaia sp. VD9]|uniref:N-acetylglucosamine kinase n=1 Tax=Asaia sp. VD9 TaxID=3081235 RepID=UPI00301766FA